MNPDYATATDQLLEVRVEAAEMDEQWSFVGSKAIHEVLVYVFGPRTDTVFKELKALLEPFNVVKYVTDDPMPLS